MAQAFRKTLYALVATLAVIISATSHASTTIDPILSFLNMEREILDRVINANKKVVDKAGWANFSLTQNIPESIYQ